MATTHNGSGTKSHGSGIFTSLSNLREKFKGKHKPNPRNISSIKDTTSGLNSTSGPEKTSNLAPKWPIEKSKPYLSPPLSSNKRCPSAESDFEVQFSARPVQSTSASATGGASGSSDSFSLSDLTHGIKLANDPYQRYIITCTTTFIYHPLLTH